MKLHWLGLFVGLAGDAALFGLVVHLTEPHMVARNDGDLVERRQRACDDDHHRRSALCGGTSTDREISACDLSSCTLLVECLRRSETR